MTMNLHISRPQRTTGMFAIVLALVSGTVLFLGCAGEPPVVTDASTDSAARDATLSKGTSGNGLIVQSFPAPEDPTTCPVCSGPPLYASGLSLGLTGFGATRTDGAWVAITFVRQPDCVPDNYNLLSGPDIPGAFACPLTIEGEAWLRELSDPNPVQIRHRGLGAVPIYFVELSEFETAVTDGQLTIVELSGLSSLLIGYAGYHRDVIHFPTQGARPGQHSIVSRGKLQDGRSFQHSGVVRGTDNVQTGIEFK